MSWPSDSVLQLFLGPGLRGRSLRPARRVEVQADKKIALDHGVYRDEMFILKDETVFRGSRFIVLYFERIGQWLRLSLVGETSMSNQTPSLTNTDGKQLGEMEFAITDDGCRGIGWEYTTTKKVEWDRPRVETAGTAHMLPYSVSQPPAHAGGCVSHGRTLGRHVQIHQVRPTRNTTRHQVKTTFDTL